MLKNKTLSTYVLEHEKLLSIFLLIVLLVLLITPRIGIYLLHIPENVSIDATSRYFPQAEKLGESLKNFYQQTGPAYSLLILIFKKLFGNPVKSIVIFQHVIGVVSALMLFNYFRRISLFVAFIIPVLVFCGPRVLSLEHSIFRESITSFLFILFFIIGSRFMNNKQLEEKAFLYGLLTGLILFTLVLFRMEYVIIYLLFPVVLMLIISIKRLQKIKGKNGVLWLTGYALPVLLAFVVWASITNRPVIKNTYGGTFNIAYYMLQPDVYYYEGSKYPELIKAYQDDLSAVKQKTGEECIYNQSPAAMCELMGAHYESTNRYLSNHPEIKLNMLGMMDTVFVEMALKNKFAYFKSVLVNFKYLLLSECVESQDNALILPAIKTKYIIADKIFYFLTIPNRINPKTVNKYLFIFFFAAFPIVAFKYRIMPAEVLLILFVMTIQLVLYSFIATPTPRFRSPMDPFIYFIQLCPLWLLLRYYLGEYKRRFIYG